MNKKLHNIDKITNGFNTTPIVETRHALSLQSSQPLKPYTQYKPSGIAWLGDIPEHWEVKSVRKSFLFSVGFTPPTGKDEYFTYSGNGIPWITIRDMKRKYIENSKQDISFLYKETFKKPLILKGSLLYSFKLSVGKVAFAKNDLFTNEAVFSVLPNENYCLNFFFYSLPNQILKNASENIYGAKILNQELIKSAKIIFPTIEEQTAIAAFLDYKTTQIDRFIRKKKQLIKLLNEQKAAIINDAVTGKIAINVETRHALSLQSSQPLKPYTQYKPSGIAWLGDIPAHWEAKKLKFLLKLQKGKNPNNFTTENVSLPYLSMEYLRGKTNIKSFVLPQENLVEVNEGDLLVLWDGANAGEIMKSKHGFLSSTMAVIKPNENFFNKNYFYQFLKGLEKQFKDFSNGTTIPHFDSDILLNNHYCIPPLSEQAAIVAHIEAETAIINKTIATIEKEIALVQEYRTALIAEAVTGKIDVRGYELPTLSEADEDSEADENDGEYLAEADEDSED